MYCRCLSKRNPLLKGNGGLFSAYESDYFRDCRLNKASVHQLRNPVCTQSFCERRPEQISRTNLVVFNLQPSAILYWPTSIGLAVSIVNCCSYCEDVLIYLICLDVNVPLPPLCLRHWQRFSINPNLNNTTARPCSRALAQSLLIL